MAATLLQAARNRDRSRHAAPQVFEQLREMILSLALAPGTVLSRSELQQQFRLSSTPIRDALLQLQDEHLVEIFPQHATVVSPIDLALARQAQFLRRSVELEIVRTLAAAPDKALIARLNAIVAQQRAFGDAGDLEQFMAMPTTASTTPCTMRPRSPICGHSCAATAAISTGCAGCIFRSKARRSRSSTTTQPSSRRSPPASRNGPAPAPRSPVPLPRLQQRDADAVSDLLPRLEEQMELNPAQVLDRRLCS